MMIRIMGNPVAQGRAKCFRRGKHIGMYDPDKSRNWKETVKWQAISQKAKMLEGALEMIINVYLQRPKTLPKKVKYPIKKPDLSNYIKGIEDALEGICYANDSQIINLVAHKHFAKAEPFTEIIINTIRCNQEVERYKKLLGDLI